MAFDDPPIKINPWQRLVHEFLGSWVVVFVGLGSVAVSGGIPGAHAFSEGFSWFASLSLFLLFGAGHFNPAITLVYMVLYYLIPGRGETSRFPWHYLGFIVVQYLGAFVAALSVWGLTGLRTFTGLGMPVIGAGFTVGNAIFAEILFATFIIFLHAETAVIVYWHKVNNNGREFMPHFLRALVLGFAIVAFTFVAHFVSGANFNIFRFLGPALLALSLGANGHVYIWPPLVAAILAGAVIAIQLYFQRPATESTPRRRSKTRILTTISQN